MARKLRAAVIGLGVGQRHALAYRAHPACEVAALCDLDPAKRAWAEETFPGARVTADAREILGAGDIEVVSVASFDDCHRDQVVMALEAGKHVFSEKPLCMDAGEARAIRGALAANPGVHLSCNLILRMCPRFRWLRREVREGRMGEIFCVEGDYNYGRIEKIAEGWRGRMDGYSAMLGGGIHLLDLVLWLTGERPVEVSAASGNRGGRGTGFRYDDYCSALLRFPGGLVAKVSANLACVHPHFHNLTVYGTRATFVNDLPDARMIRSRRSEDGWERVTEAYPGADKGALIAGFLDAILAGGSQPIPAEEVFAALAVAFAIEEAARTRSVVPVDYA